MQNAMACRVFRILRRMVSEEKHPSLPSELDECPGLTIVFVDPHSDESKLTVPVVCHLPCVGKESQLARAL